MKTIFPLIIIMVFAIGCKQKKVVHNPPTEIRWDMEDGSLKDEKKVFFDMLHRSGPNVDWREIEQETAWKNHQQKALKRKQVEPRGDDDISIANGKVIGFWTERGSINQVGSVFKTLCNSETNTVSSEGPLWKGGLDGLSWEVINQDIRFSERFLFIYKKDDGSKRLVAADRGDPIYSEDDGETWNYASGFNAAASGYRHKNELQLSNQEIYFLGRTNSSSNVKLMRSTDGGLIYNLIFTFNTNQASKLSLCNPHNTEDVYAIQQTTDDLATFYKVNQALGSLEVIQVNSPAEYDGERTNLVGTQYEGNTIRFYIFDEQDSLKMSEDFGESWEYLNILPASPWYFGVYVSKYDPDQLLWEKLMHTEALMAVNFGNVSMRDGNTIVMSRTSCTLI